MAKETFTGPVISLGGLAGGQGGSQPREYSDELGPSIFWGGHAIPLSASTGSKDRTGPGTIATVYASSPIRTINAAISAGNQALTTAANAVAGQALPNLATYALGRAPVPVIAAGVSSTGIALDMGLDTATYAATGGVTIGGVISGTATLATVANAWRYRVGQWICLMNGAASGQAAMSQIVAITLATGVLSMVPPPVAATGQIALTNRYNPNLYGASGPPSSIASMAAAGTARVIIPEVGNTRGLGITVAGAGLATTVDILGTDASGTVQTETLITGAGAGTTWSKKTYDTFISATPRTADARNYTIVTSDFIGFPLPILSVDSIVTMTLNAVAIPAVSFVIIPADQTVPITPTTGDPRGGIQTTANGPLAAPGTPLPFTGTVLTVDQRLHPLQVALGGY